MQVIGVIPSRYASQRLPAKPLVQLLGKTMIQRVYEQAKKARLLQRVIVATDDERIASVVRGFGAEVVLTSPEIKSGSDRVAEVAKVTDADIYLNVQGDEPLIAPEMIDQAARLLIDDPQAVMGTLAKSIADYSELVNPSVVKVVLDEKSNALYFSRSTIPYIRDDAESPTWLGKHRFYKHIGLYAFRRDFLLQFSGMKESRLEKAERLEQLRVLEHGYRIKIAITEHDSIPIDTQSDVDRVVRILENSTTSHTAV
jgi:3-deoxy-manno-octulosonate cytidylyltransferase (CMP-KDO synthetase)